MGEEEGRVREDKSQIKGLNIFTFKVWQICRHMYSVDVLKQAACFHWLGSAVRLQIATGPFLEIPALIAWRVQTPWNIYRSSWDRKWRIISKVTWLHNVSISACRDSQDPVIWVSHMSTEDEGNVEKVQERIARIQQLRAALGEETQRNVAAAEKSDLCQHVTHFI